MINVFVLLPIAFIVIFIGFVDYYRLLQGQDRNDVICQSSKKLWKMYFNRLHIAQTSFFYYKLQLQSIDFLLYDVDPW